MDDDTKGAAVMGVLLGMILMAAMASFGITGDAKAVLEECEANLPRDQHCVITAVPAKE